METLTAINEELEDATSDELRLLLVAMKFLESRAGEGPVNKLRWQFPKVFARLDRLENEPLPQAPHR